MQIVRSDNELVQGSVPIGEKAPNQASVDRCSLGGLYFIPSRMSTAGSRPDHGSNLAGALPRFVRLVPTRKHRALTNRKGGPDPR